MNKANQDALVQAVNIQLINIRLTEINYFSTFFNNFRTQCALLIGVLTTIVSQLPVLNNPAVPYPWQVFYWITTAIALACATHVLVATTFVSVYGQGLAIRGQLGSMITAVDGMITEQNDILVMFVATLFFFNISCIGMYVVMMDLITAAISSVLTVIVFMVWYHYALRIYNRFNMSMLKTKWTSTDDGRSSDDITVNPIQSTKPQLNQFLNNNTNNNSINNNKSLANNITSFFGFKKNNNNNNNTSRYEEMTTWTDKTLDNIETLAEEHKNIAIGGYLTLLIVNRQGQESWARKYFVVINNNMNYYQNKRAYDLDPNQSDNARPIELQGYSLKANVEDNNKNNKDNNNVIYSIQLIPSDPEDIRRAWQFRCDTRISQACYKPEEG
eukprot:gene14341-19234_t